MLLLPELQTLAYLLPTARFNRDKSLWQII